VFAEREPSLVGRRPVWQKENRRMQKRSLRGVIPLAALAVAIMGLTAPGATASTPTSGAVYDSIPTNPPGNVASLGYEATQTQELGDVVRLGPGGRVLDSVRVLMSSWGCEDGTWHQNATPPCTTTPGATFDHELTLNIYSVDSSGEPDTLLASQTETFAIPYRPSADASNCSGGRWFDGTTCFNGFATPVEWNFSGPAVTLPNKVVWSVAYNTTHYGYDPIGEAAACYTESGGCGYDSLNVGAETLGDPDAGQDVNEADAVYSSANGGNDCDGGTGGAGAIRLDAGCWTGYRPLAEIITTGSTDTVVVKPSATSGWGILPNGNVAVTTNNATGVVVAGPGGQNPLLPGSVEFQTKSGPGGKPQLYAPATYAGTKLNELTSLSYQSYISQYATGSSHLTHTLNVFIDRDGSEATTGDRHTLVYEPCYTTSCAGPVQPLNTWTTYDSLAPGAIWWSTSVIPGTDFTAAFGSYVPLDSLLDAYPNATIRVIGVQAGQSSGGAPWNDFVGNLDGVAIGVNGNETVYDFEPDPVCTVEVQPPLRVGSENMVQKGQVVPVKITVTCDGQLASGLTPAIQLLKGDKTGSPDSISDWVVTESVSGADTTGVMREVDSMYIYNLRVPSSIGSTALTKGDELTIRIRPLAPGNTVSGLTDIVLQIRK
jgi:hypothetical protein